MLVSKWAKPAAAVVAQGTRVVDRGGAQPDPVDLTEVPSQAGGQRKQVATESPTDAVRDQPELGDLDIAPGMPVHQDHADDLCANPSDPAPHPRAGQQIQPLLFGP